MQCGKCDMELGKLKQQFVVGGYSGGRAGFDTGAARRADPRAACEVRRRLAAEGLLAVFFDFDR